MSSVLVARPVATSPKLCAGLSWCRLTNNWASIELLSEIGAHAAPREASMNTARAFLRTWALIFLLTWTGALRAQLNRGVIEGLVTDPLGAVVPNQMSL